MRLRSLLFVPGDSERKFAKASVVGADALILDLEDSVGPTRKPFARKSVSELVNTELRSWRLLVRINALCTPFALEDLAAVVRPGLDAILIPKINGLEDIECISHYVDALEIAAGVAPGHVKLLAVATETAGAMLNFASYLKPSRRLVALTWGAEDLSTALGALANAESNGVWSFPYQIARAQCLFAAATAGVTAIDTLYSDFRDLKGLEERCKLARRDGFLGSIAIHPDQVAVINVAFTPSEADLAFARKIVEAFEADPSTGTVGIDGRMYDIPHLVAARRVLASTEEGTGR
jgi:citrate lyase subunit beta/citryl-CoA lyase